ncbi:MFS transporter [Pseudidiomarina salinarum]|uniref:MFS transporter n=1 Tax=Pseudidiomarina salinarum TaxID=435908 RepID=A0A094JFR3_9GAMM|nr:MFS transporter [Pseudidiomarina salinarum]KFZ31371.1 MFS transporter [Pseudidiomarina salinarum]RUO70869.1 MFS transporter [Pseudidiomarina salinarum]
MTYTVAANGHAARVMLAFLATAGLFYVNIMPALVSGMIEGLGFSNRDAGLIGSFNIYGAAFGAFVAIFLIKRIQWKPVCAGLLVLLMALDALSMLISLELVMMVMRALHGFVGGLLVGVSFAVIARTAEVHKTFGMLLLVQFGLGGLGVMTLPPLVPILGSWILFMALIAFSFTALVMLKFLPGYPVVIPDPSELVEPVKKKPLFASVFAVFLFQAANMALYAYIIDLGQQAGLTMSTISPALGISAWMGILGSVAVITLSTRLGRTLPILIGILITAAATYALHYAFNPLVFWLANIAVGITWAFSIAYLLGVCSEFDKAGQMAALGGFASKMGLASGPMFAAFVVSNSDYGALINTAVVLLVIGALVTLYPSRLLDKAA